MVQKNNTLYFLENYTQKGFVFAPFDIQKRYHSFSMGGVQFRTINIANSDKNLIRKDKRELISDEGSRLKHIELVKKGIDFLKKENLRKVVLSRKEEISFGEVSVSELFSRLIKFVPFGFCICLLSSKSRIMVGSNTGNSIKN